MRAWFAVFISVVLLSACGLPNLQRAQPTVAVPIDLPLETQAQLRDFDLAVRALRATYIDPNALGANWQAAVTTYRDQVARGLKGEEFLLKLKELLGTLNDEDLVLVSPPVTSTVTGVGIMISPPQEGKDRILALAVYPGSPAERAGLKPHDAITAVDGKPVTAEEGADAVLRIRGQSGTRVTLTVKSPGQAARDVTATREPISPTTTLVARRVPGTNIGYIQPDFSDMGSMRLGVSQALRDLSSPQSLDGLVLDLRVTQQSGFRLTDMLGLFANDFVGTLVTRTAKSKLIVTGKDIANSQVLPLIVLVGDQTRGEAESFAGILQDLGRARVAGAPTSGRLAELTRVILPNAGVLLQIPSGEYRGVKDTSWYRKGIKPDIPSDLTWEQFTTEDDPQLKQAVDALTQK